MTPVLQIENVSKTFRHFTAVSDVSLDIEPGEFLAIMGSSGSGKSTLLRLIAGLERPSKGRILLDGRPTENLAVHERVTPMVWQSLALFPFLTAVENVEFGLRMQGIGKAERRARAMTWLDRMEIAHLAQRNIDALSGGQRQRVALARALVTEPPVLLLDEPLSALDAHLTVRMQSVLTGLQRELGITFIYVTHSHSEAFAMADRVVIMREGRIEQIGAPKELYMRPSSRFVAEFLGSNNIFSGTLEEDATGRRVLNTDDGPIRLPSADRAGQASCSRADLVVSSDRMVIGGDVALDNCLTARVIGEEFVGSGINLFLETKAGSEIIVQVPQREMDRVSISPGDDLTVGWPMDDGHLIPTGEADHA